MSAHDEHFCRICDTFCAWCSHCGLAHCMNGHEHDGFDGPGQQLRFEDHPVIKAGELRAGKPKGVTSMKRFVARQGDVLIERTTKRAIKGTRASRVDGRLILAEGEATGHAHAISDVDVEMFITEQEAYLVVEQEAMVIHEEHASIALAPGTYRVSRQREYSPDAIRNVAD